MLTGRQCRAARGLLGWSQQQLADACGLSKTAINNFETKGTALKQSSESSIQQAFESNNLELLDDEGVRIRKDHARVLRGENALHALWEDILTTLPEGGEVLITNVHEEKGYEHIKDDLARHLKKLRERNITERLICKKSATKFPAPKAWYRAVDDTLLDYASEIFIYKNKVAVMLWGESMIILIESQDAANAEKKRFETLWLLGEKIA